MKRTILTALILLTAAIAALAAKPRLACDALFADKYKNSPNTSITIVNSPGNSFRSIKVDNDPKIVKEMVRLVNEDRRQAQNTVEKYRGGNVYKLILNIPVEDGCASIGFDRYSDADARLFISITSPTSLADPAGSTQIQIEMPDSQGCRYGYVEGVLCPLLRNLDTIVTEIDNPLRDSVYLVADHDGILSVSLYRETLQAD